MDPTIRIALALLTVIILGSCTGGDTAAEESEPQTVQLGDTVTVEYSGSLPNGTVFDPGDEPFTLQIGAGQAIPGFDNGLLGLELNERATLEIPPDQAYGEYTEELIQAVSVEEFGIDPSEHIGEYIRVSTPQGQMIQAYLIGVENETVILDLNHRLAGETLIFEVEVIDIQR